MSAKSTANYQQVPIDNHSVVEIVNVYTKANTIGGAKCRATITATDEEHHTQEVVALDSDPQHLSVALPPDRNLTCGQV